MMMLLFQYGCCLFSEMSGYAEKKIFIAIGKTVTFIHRHDWSRATDSKRRKMFLGSQNPFAEDNNFAYIECFLNETNQVLFRVPSPALNYLFVSKDSKYLIGLSKLKNYNPVQLVVFDMKGNLVFYSPIQEEESKMNIDEFETFKAKYPKYALNLIGRNRISQVGDTIFIYPGTIPPISKKVWYYLFSYNATSHLSSFFRETTTNFIYWYKEPDPEIQLKYEDGKISAVSLLDPIGKRFEIVISEVLKE